MLRQSVWYPFFCEPPFTLAVLVAVSVTVLKETSAGKENCWLTIRCFRQFVGRTQMCHAYQYKFYSPTCSFYTLQRTINLKDAKYAQYKADCTDDCALNRVWCEWQSWSIDSIPCEERKLRQRKREKCCKPYEILPLSMRMLCDKSRHGIDKQSMYNDESCSNVVTKAGDVKGKMYIFMVCFIPAIILVLICTVRYYRALRHQTEARNRAQPPPHESQEPSAPNQNWVSAFDGHVTINSANYLPSHSSAADNETQPPPSSTPDSQPPPTYESTCPDIQNEPLLCSTADSYPPPPYDPETLPPRYDEAVKLTA